MKASIICEKCGFRTKPFDSDDRKAYAIAMRNEVYQHAELEHKESPRLHNYTHIEFWSEWKKAWRR